jgi:2'-hydroxyisoflavone reductase
VGRHITDAAIERGHEVTLFNRGLTNPDLYPQLERLVGDRDGDLRSLHDRRWDAVIDVNGYLPHQAQGTATLLSDAVAHYTFISTMSVYASFESHGQNENSPLAEIGDRPTDTVMPETYGALKVLCEGAVMGSFPDRALILRPGYVVGPHDPSDRFTSWVRRVSQGGDMLAPGSADSPIQLIDARDLAAFSLDQVENGTTGVYNTTGPAHALTWGNFFDRCIQVSDALVEITWVDEGFIIENELTASDVPMWAPGESAGVMTMNINRASAQGLTFRPLIETIGDTLAWDREHGTPQAGLSSELEKQLLRDWRNSNPDV